MDSCDVLIVGGGPAGSSCAWGLRGTGLDVLIVDRAKFPREKLCGGWITPLVLEELDLDPARYSEGRTLQAITGFRIGSIGSEGVQIGCDGIASYGIRRCEFDEYLLRRSGARVRDGYTVDRVERAGAHWVVNGEIRARMLVGAGGHFCPIPRLTENGEKRQAVVAREVEFEMPEEEAARCGAAGEVPELYFCRDMRGYGWCFRKGRFLNVGLGRLDPHRLGDHVDEFVAFLKSSRGMELAGAPHFSGHAYFLFGQSHRRLIDDGLLLVGDSAGLAFAQSGEGIRPAVESGLLAASVITAADGKYVSERLRNYEELLTKRFGQSHTGLERAANYLPNSLRNGVARGLLRTPWFARFVVERWFLRGAEPRLAPMVASRTTTPSVA